MRSIRGRINVVNRDGWSSYTAFAHAISSKKFSPLAIRPAFNKLVDKSDYDKKEKMDILKYLYTI